MVKIFPFIFVILWSSAFVTTKPIIDNSDPFAALAFRFFFVAFGFFIFSLYAKHKILTNTRNLLQSLFSGVLFHGVYLGGVFYSVSIGMPTGIAALIVTLQPILTNALAGKFLGEKVTFKQWIGVILGFIGAALVLGFDIGSSLPVFGVIASFIALLAITTSTLWQKKISNNLPLSVSNMYQAMGGEEKIFNECLDLLKQLGNPTLVGPVSSGQISKLANQIIVGVTIGAVAEAVTLCEKSGTNPSKMIEALSGGWADSKILQTHGKRMVDKDFSPKGKTTTQLKDMTNIVNAGKAADLHLPISSLIKEMYKNLVDEGHGNTDHSSLYNEIKKLNKIK